MMFYTFFFEKNCNDSHLMFSLGLMVSSRHNTIFLNNSQRCMMSCVKMKMKIKLMMAVIPSLPYLHPKFHFIHLLLSANGSVMTTWMTILAAQPICALLRNLMPFQSLHEGRHCGITNFMNLVIFG